MKKTYSKTKEQALKEREWHVVDAADVPLGRLASEVAGLIRGKNKPSFTAHVDCGDFVIVVNADKVKLTGRKREQKTYYSHSGFIGGLKAETADSLMARKPEEVVVHAVKGMLPRGALGHQLMGKLKVYTGIEHPHRAQQPKPYKLQFVRA
jgi:large subunit ribosomal protein L13